MAKREMVTLIRRARARMMDLMGTEKRVSVSKNLITGGAVRTCRIGRMG